MTDQYLSGRKHPKNLKVGGVGRLTFDFNDPENEQLVVIKSWVILPP